LGYIAGGEFRFATSRALFARALEFAPSSATVYQWYGRMLLYEGDFARAYEITLKAVMLDPKAPIMHWAHVNVLRALGRDDEAVAVCETPLADPASPFCERIKFSVAVRRQDYPTARAALRRMSEPRGEEAMRFSDALMDALEGKSDSRAVAAQLADLPDGQRDSASLSPLSSGQVVFVLTTMGYKDLALRWVRQFAQVSPYVARSLLLGSQLHALACEPEFQALARELEIDEARAAALCQAGE
jgi:tetratricopeptide (TPR) repeat protein